MRFGEILYHMVSSIYLGKLCIRTFRIDGNVLDV